MRMAYYWITGRVDDVLNVSGTASATAEVESALVLHDSVAEAAVVGCPHDIKGQCIYAYVMPMRGITPSDELIKELKAYVAEQVWLLCQTGFRAMDPRPAEDPFGQDHAPHSAQDRLR